MDLNQIVREHMEKQPYSAHCSVCDSQLKAEASDVDSDLDLNIKVAPCGFCLARQYEKGKEDA